MVKNGSYGATGNSFVWSINIEAYNQKDKYEYDEGDNATFSIRMLPSTEDYTVLGQTSNFAIRKPANGQRPALWYAQQRIDLNGGGQNDVCDTLTANAKAGVGVGVAVGVILIAINTAWFILSVKRKDRAHPSVEAAQSQQPQQQQIIPPPVPDSRFFSHLSMPPLPPFFPGPSLAPAPYEPQSDDSFANNTSPISNGRRRSDATSKRVPGELPGNGTEHDPIFGSGESRRSSSRERQ
ncbi:hypothetical protein KEM56_001431 [Ascosphaera pollenicola]|nr:hypothetical protein KEM56_001431 [Ascosphaera pollenicola]